MRIKKGIVKNQPTPRLVEDVDLENRIVNFLHQKQVPRGERIHMDAHVGTVVISGQLPSRHAKWLCIECCRHVAGVIKLIDKVAVQSEARKLAA